MMLQTLMVRLVPDGEQRAMLLKTVDVFNSACNHIAAVAFREKCFSTYQLHTFVYHDVREKFKLSSQMAVDVKTSFTTKPHPGFAKPSLGGRAFLCTLCAWMSMAALTAGPSVLRGRTGEC